jgi:protein-tyrosine phosphatase
MIDIHSHVLPGIDDGAPTLEAAKLMLDEAQKAGVRVIVATPHFSRELHENGMRDQVFDAVLDEALRFGIKLLKGYEIKIHHYPGRMPRDFSGLDLAGTKLILLELPLDSVPSYTPDLVYRIQLQGFVPIIAHPERCRRLGRDREMLDELIDAGCLLQIDAASIIGINGRRAKRFARKLIKKGKASFVASDAHRPAGYSVWYAKAYKKVVKWVGKGKADDLFRNNAADIFGLVGEGSLNAVI